MNTLKKIPALLALTLLASLPASAALESLKIEPTYLPPLSPTMLMDGVTGGRVNFAIAVSAEGKVTDCLVLGTTHPALVGPCMDALKQWKITPARVDGVPVAVQTDLSVDYSAEGVVVSRNSVLDLDNHVQRVFGYRLAKRQVAPNQLDAVPHRLTVAPPSYSKQAEKDGVRGTVRVHFFIDENGAVRMPAVEGSPHPYLSEMAVSAVKEWRFAPPTSRGKRVLVAARQDFNFSK